MSDGSQRILVTGAAGFIGSHLCEALLARGDDVIAIDNFDPFYDHAIKQRNIEGCLSHARFHFFQVDLRDGDALEAYWRDHVGELDAIVHLAAKAGVRPSIEDPLGYERANVHATMNLLQQAVAMAKRPRLVFASSSSVYGNNQSIPFRETDPVDHPISPYAATKKAGELLCHTYHHLYQMPIWCLRFFTVFGPRQRPDLAIHAFTRKILAGEPIAMFGDGTSSRDYTYIDDILAGVLAAIDRCAGYEILNLGSKHPVQLSEMIATIEQALGLQAEIIRKPMQPGDVNCTFADVEKAARLLDYQPTVPFAAGVERFVAWIRENGRN
jgi:UDP-glucuronate 4-epimerase